MGGYFADPGYKEVPELWNIGFPIAEVDESGTTRISKLPDAGGRVTAASVKEQLLYEIQDPRSYLTPDAVADFSGIRVRDPGDGSMRVKAWFGPIVSHEVVRYEVPSLGALNFVLHGALGGGVTRSLALDMHGKSLSSLLLEMEVDVEPGIQ